jgi:long-chain fatty acid transport protein
MAAMSGTGAMAGGFAIREQSTLFQGLAFAGSAAGGNISSIYWNSAATAALDGMNTDSNYALLIGRAEVKVEEVTGNSTVGVPAPVIQGYYAGQDDSTDISDPAVISASYGNYQVSDKLYIGFGSNAPFGLKTEPDDEEYQGAPLARKTSLFTLNANPTVAYKLSSTLTIGAGIQIQYADAIFKFASGVPQANTTTFSQDDWAVGATAGILFTPMSGTTIGLGWRSQMTHEFEGRLSRNATGVLPPIIPGIPELSIGAETELDLPDIVTLSLRTNVTPNMRLMGTVEWTNWERFENLTLKATEAGTNPVTNAPISAGDTIAVLDANWSDGWFFSLGGEYDYNEKITLRAGAAYEISPVDSPEKRIVAIPDADRVWLSLGGSYDYSASTTLDFAYTHIFIEDEKFERQTLGTALRADISGSIEAEADIVSVGMRTKW